VAPKDAFEERSLMYTYGVYGRRRDGSDHAMKRAWSAEALGNVLFFLHGR
jgi:hypothetical protein